MNNWRIPVVWQEKGLVEIKADTLAEAVEIAKDEGGIIPIPYEHSYVDGSWAVESNDVEYLRNCYNCGQQDNAEEEQVPVVHAFWKRTEAYYGDYICSHCEATWNDIRTPYCHNCGAKMDQKDFNL